MKVERECFYCCGLFALKDSCEQLNIQQTALCEYETAFQLSVTEFHQTVLLVVLLVLRSFADLSQA